MIPAGVLGSVVLLTTSGWFRSTAAWLRSTARSLLLGNADLHMNVLRLLAARTWIRFPAWIENFDDLLFGTWCDVIQIFVLHAFVEFMRLFSDWLRSFFVTFMVIKASDESAREQRADFRCRSHTSSSHDGNRTKHTCKLSHCKLS